MRATLDWSHELLSEPEKDLFARLSVFAGGFALEAAETVGGGREPGDEDVLVLLERLVEQSLVLAEPGKGGRRAAALQDAGAGRAVRNREARGGRRGGGDLATARRVLPGAGRTGEARA